MHKIYSRKRLLIPRIQKTKIFPKSEKHMKKLVKCVMVLLIAFSVTVFVSKAIGPVFETVCRDEAKALATKITNEEATNVMREYNYQELFTIEKDSNGNITMIKSNVFPINEIISSIAIRIQEDINNYGRNSVKIPLGTFSGVEILAGQGPNVNIKISSVGNVETNLKSEFYEQGINQTLHRVFLQVKCNISILTPFSNTEENITNQVLIAENVIVGQIPSSYYNLEGMTKNETTDIIE